MLLTKLKELTAVLLAVTLLGSGAVLLNSRTLGEEPKPVRTADRPPPAGKDDGKAKAEDEAKKEKERLQGTWKLVAVDGSGKPKSLIGPGEAKNDGTGERRKDEPTEQADHEEGDEVNGRIVFSGDEFTAKKGDQVLYKCKFKLDISKSPKEIDLEVVEVPPPNEDKEGKTSLGIYALDGDDLKLCLATPGEGDRPTKVAGEAGRHVLLTLKREKN